MALKITFVVPAYRSSKTITASLLSLFEPVVPIPHDWELETLVVDDGSPDRNELLKALEAFPQIRLFTHEKNRGIAAARNTGLMASTGDVVTYLDSDDTLVPEWPASMIRILAEWPPDTNMCLSACVNLEGAVTASVPDYTGPYTLDDRLNEIRAGEYLPLFRGPYIRKRGGYFDTEMLRECGNISFLNFLSDGQAWITTHVLRIYHCSPVSGTMALWLRPDNAKLMVRCYDLLMEKHGETYRKRSPRFYRINLLRYATYLRMAGQPGAWRAWMRGAHWSCLPQTIGAMAMLLLGYSFAVWLIETAKNLGLVKRYG